MKNLLINIGKKSKKAFINKLSSKKKDKNCSGFESSTKTSFK